MKDTSFTPDTWEEYKRGLDKISIRNRERARQFRRQVKLIKDDCRKCTIQKKCNKYNHKKYNDIGQYECILSIERTIW